MKNELKRLLFTVSAIILLISTGTFGYIYIENLTFLNALYMTVITLSSVGFSEVTPLSTEGKIFTIFVILSGITIFLYLLGVITSIILEGFFIDYIKGVKMKKLINNLEKHTIIVGYGRTGENLVDNFIKNNTPFVLIENSLDAIDRFKIKYPLKNFLYICGDATDDQTLIDAGIKKAATFIPVLSNDADNLFTTMSAKFLNPNLNIIARVNDNHNSAKLKKAGANVVLSPHEVTARRIYNLATENNILTFTDFMENYQNTKDITLSKVKICHSSPVIGKNLIELEIPKKTGLIIIGIGHDNYVNFNPDPHTVIDEGNTLLTMGTFNQIKKLEHLCKCESEF
ncbi:MAG: NAD-binding protein [Fusobacteriaceae bacterium]|nr:NAD-binding protein [Fusobacteriaceae bacterium]MBP9509559.1 NAD-binding protein [Fusobacteriaceae bacterium]